MSKGNPSKRVTVAAGETPWRSWDCEGGHRAPESSGGRFLAVRHHQAAAAAPQVEGRTEQSRYTFHISNDLPTDKSDA